MTNDDFLSYAEKLTVAFALAFIGSVVFITLTTQGVLFGENGVVGGDFLAFYTAGDLAAKGRALEAYELSTFEAALFKRAPREHLGLMWQYPPSMFFLTATLPALPYKAAYFLWMALTGLAMAGALHRLGATGRSFRLLALSPLCIFVFISGQISLLTGALLIIATLRPDRHWLAAGIAAGLLTMKPQLGLLAPLAFLAVGAWRAVATAVFTGVVVHTPSLAAFGFEGWQAFFAAVARLNADVVGPGLNTPPQGMTTLFGQLRSLGAPSLLALVMHYALALAVALVAWRVWRRDADALGKCAVLCAGAILASPYAYAYEMTALIPAALYIAREARNWSSPLAIMLAAGWTLAAFRYLTPEGLPIETAFALSLGAFSLAAILALGRAPQAWRAPLAKRVVRSDGQTARHSL